MIVMGGFWGDFEVKVDDKKRHGDDAPSIEATQQLYPCAACRRRCSCTIVPGEVREEAEEMQRRWIRVKVDDG